MHGFRGAARRLLATPGFTCVALLTISLSIAANASIFALVDAVLLKPPPFRDPSSLLQVWSVREGGSEVSYVRPGIVAEWRRRLTDVVAAIEPYEFRAATLIGAGEPDVIPTVAVGGGLMDTLGVRPLLGRTLQRADALSGHPRVAVIAEALWRTRFGSDPEIVGRTIRLDAEAHEIVGVMPRAFRFPRSHQVWIPLVSAEPGARSRPGQAIARLRPGVSVEVGQQRLEAVARALEQGERSPYGWRHRLHPFGHNSTSQETRLALYLLLGSVGVVLLIACANIAGLMLVRGSDRGREMAVRAALGANRSQLIRPLVGEAVLLTGAAVIVGGIAAIWLTELLVRLAPPVLIRLSHNDVVPGWRTLAFTAFISVLTAALVGLLPGWRASRVNAADMLRSGTAAPRQQRFRQFIVIGQLALATVLLVGGVLLAKTFAALTRVDTRFDTAKVLTADLTVQPWKYPSPAAQRQLFADVLARLQRIPGVQRVSLSGGVPPGGGFSFGFQITTDDGRHFRFDEEGIAFTDVDDQYFAALGLPLREGRGFSADEIANPNRGMVISQALARLLWSDGGAVGRRFRIDEEEWSTVIGVAADVFQFDYLRSDSVYAAYYPLSARLPIMRTIVIRGHGAPEQLGGPVRAAIREVDPEQPIFQIATAEELYESFLAPPRFYAYLVGVFAALAALLSAIGLYGVVSYAVAQRGREFGIRLALGADAVRLRTMVLGQGLLLIVGGMLLGVIVSVLATGAVRSLLFGIDRLDRSTYAVVLAFIAGTGLFACWLPARRASATDPAVALRVEP